MEGLLNLIYPHRCVVCDKILGDQRRSVCRGCAETIRFLEHPLCFRCGRPLEQEEEYCETCKRYEFRYDSGFAPFAYRGGIRQSLIRFKYGHRAEYASFYARAILKFGEWRIAHWKPDILLAVPVHRRRQIKRGYNQASLVAEELSRLTGIPCRNSLIRRTRHTKPQKELDIYQRRANLKNAFCLNPKEAADIHLNSIRSAVIIDDIYTTGSTVDTIAAILKNHHVQEVHFITVSIAGRVKSLF